MAKYPTVRQISLTSVHEIVRWPADVQNAKDTKKQDKNITLPEVQIEAGAQRKAETERTATK